MAGCFPYFYFLCKKSNKTAQNSFQEKTIKNFRGRWRRGNYRTTKTVILIYNEWIVRSSCHYMNATLFHFICLHRMSWVKAPQLSLRKARLALTASTHTINVRHATWWATESGIPIIVSGWKWNKFKRSTAYYIIWTKEFLFAWCYLTREKAVLEIALLA